MMTTTRGHRTCCRFPVFINKGNIAHDAKGVGLGPITYTPVNSPVPDCLEIHPDAFNAGGNYWMTSAAAHDYPNKIKLGGFVWPSYLNYLPVHASETRLYSMKIWVPDDMSLVGETFYVDTVSFQEATITGDFLDDSIGNVVFGEDAAVGIKKWTEAELTTQGDYWYNLDYFGLRMYSVNNPATYYGQMELAIHEAAINFEDDATYITIDGLHPCYAGWMGIEMSSGASHITIQNNEVHYCGGGSSSSSPTIRDGGGINTGGNAEDTISDTTEVIGVCLKYLPAINP